jgi:hypothetical protein
VYLPLSISRKWSMTLGKHTYEKFEGTNAVIRSRNQRTDNTMAKRRTNNTDVGTYLEIEYILSNLVPFYRLPESITASLFINRTNVYDILLHSVSFCFDIFITVIDFSESDEKPEYNQTPWIDGQCNGQLIKNDKLSNSIQCFDHQKPIKFKERPQVSSSSTKFISHD